MNASSTLDAPRTATRRTASDAQTLLAAVEDVAVEEILVDGFIDGLQAFRLLPGQRLRAASPRSGLRFRAGGDGVQLSCDNVVEGLRLDVGLDCRALSSGRDEQTVGSTAVRDLRRGIETRGGVEDSVVKGVIVPLAAIALTVKAGGSLGEIDVRGGLLAATPGVSRLEVDGEIGVLDVAGGLAISGRGENDRA